MTRLNGFLPGVESYQGAQLIGHKDGSSGRGKYSGIVFPNIFPGTGYARSHRLRLAKTDYEGKKSGCWRYRPGEVQHCLDRLEYGGSEGFWRKQVLNKRIAYAEFGVWGSDIEAFIAASRRVPMRAGGEER